MAGRAGATEAGVSDERMTDEQVDDIARRAELPPAWEAPVTIEEVRDLAAEARRARQHERELEAHVNTLRANVKLLRDVSRRVEDLPDVGHDGDEESGQHDEDCEGCLVEGLKAQAEYALDATPADCAARLRAEVLEDAARVAEQPYGDEVQALGSMEPGEVGRRIAAAIRAKVKPWRTWTRRDGRSRR